MTEVDLKCRDAHTSQGEITSAGNCVYIPVSYAHHGVQAVCVCVFVARGMQFTVCVWVRVCMHVASYYYMCHDTSRILVYYVKGIS